MKFYPERTFSISRKDMLLLKQKSTHYLGKFKAILT